MENTRRHFLKHLAFGSALVMMPLEKLMGGIILQGGFAMKNLRGNVGYFTERGGTIGYLISKDGIAVVDTQFPDTAGHLISEIKKQAERQIDLLINTHHHGDHTAGNIAFKGLARKVVAHENSKKNQMKVAGERGSEDQQLYPDEVYNEQWSGKVGDETVSLRYFGPAHTDGDSVVHFENANVVHMGDLIFNRRHPFIDKSAGASIKNWSHALEQIRKAYDRETIFIFGHAGENHPVIGNMQDLAAMQNYLDQLLAIVSKKLKDGASREEIMRIDGIPGAGEWQGEGINRPLTAALEELAS